MTEKKETIKLNLQQRINKVMKEVTYIKKREKKTGMQYNFVSHDDVTAALHLPLAEAGIHCSSDVLSYVIDGTRHTVQVKATFTNIDDPQDKLTVQGYGSAIDSQDKGYGKALSYAMKYICLKNFMLESGDEDEVDGYQGQKEPEPKPEKAQLPKSEKLVVESDGIPRLHKEQVGIIRDMIKDYPDIREAVLKFTKKTLISDIESGKYNDVINFINMKLSQEGAA
jgi:hypothetical protein